MDRKETFRIAIQSEIHSQNLYLVLAKSFRNSETSAMFQLMIPMEKLHEEKLTTIFESECPGETLDLDPNLIPDIDPGLINDPKSVLEFAISRELTAHAIYIDLAAGTGDPDLKKLLLKFADEELNHKTVLETEIQRLQGMIQWYDPSELNGMMEY